MYEYWAKLDRVIDGDTVSLSVDLGHNVFIVEKYRLIDIDAPEVRTKDLKEKEAGIKSKERLIQILTGKSLRILTVKDRRGKFGRYLVEIFLRDDPTSSINQRMIQEGFAKPYP